MHERELNPPTLSLKISLKRQIYYFPRQTLRVRVSEKKNQTFQIHLAFELYSRKHQISRLSAVIQSSVDCIFFSLAGLL